MTMKSKSRQALMRRRNGDSFMFCFVLLLTVVEGSWVDPDTPKEFHSTVAMTPFDEREYELVFSDEFEKEGRTFHDGMDPRWTALNKNDYTNAALHFYSHDNVWTSNGTLNILSEHKDNPYKAFNEKTKKFYMDKKHVQSGMVQGWNKFCLTGGIVEFSARLPGDPSVGGLWPALWLLGNLARATYVGSSDFMWPFSYNRCNEKERMSQEINACSHVGHYGLHPGRGRGAPEIDVLEAMQGDASKLPNTDVTRPYGSQSYQVAPGLKTDRPVLGKLPKKSHWYSDLEFGNTSTGRSELNPFFYGVTLVHEPKSYTYQSDAISANVNLNTTNYQDFHSYRIEWDPPEVDGTGGYIRWYVDGEFSYAVKGSSLSITGSEIPSEPMYLLINTAIASSWGFPAPCPEGCECDCFECGNPDCACALPTGYCDNFPATFEIEHVRVWQAVNESKHILGCSTPDRPTSVFIKGHPERYMEGDAKRPLEPVSNGGASCSTDEECGGTKQGECEDGRACRCYDGYTGPRCMSHDGFYDNPWEVDTTDYSPDIIYVPVGLITATCILAVGFVAALIAFMRQKRRTLAYSKISGSTGENSHGPVSGDAIPQMASSSLSRGGLGASAGLASSSSGYGSISGQAGYSPNTAAGADYALPTNNPKVVTYLVIDGRLVDQ